MADDVGFVASGFISPTPAPSSQLPALFVPRPASIAPSHLGATAESLIGPFGHISRALLGACSFAATAAICVPFAKRLRRRKCSSLGGVSGRTSRTALALNRNSAADNADIVDEADLEAASWLGAATFSSSSSSMRSGEPPRQTPKSWSRSDLPELEPADCLRLRMGQTVQKQERHGHWGQGFVVQDVDAPPSVVMGCLESFEEYPDMIPVVKQAQVNSRLGRANGSMTVYSKYRISKFWLSVSVVHHVDRTQGLVRFDLDPTCAGTGLVLREASGFWHVQPSPDGNPNRSRVWLVSGLRASTLLPHWLLDYAAERALRRATTWLRPHVEDLWAQEKIRQQQEARPWHHPLPAPAATLRPATI